MFSHKLTSVVKGRFSHWTPGKMSGKVTFWPSLSAAPGGFLRAFSNNREKRWSSQVLFILSENALYNNDTMRINQTLRTQGKAAVVTVCMSQYLQNAVAKNTPSAAAWSCSMDTNRSLVTKTIFMPPSLFLTSSPTHPPNPHLSAINPLKPITIWLYLQAGRMKTILCSDWLWEWARLAHLSCLGLNFP